MEQRGGEGGSDDSSSLKLLGSWASSYTHRVQLALKLKGLHFEYLEEDLAKKSPALLLHNPIYQKVPVLLHCGRPILESALILQYIDEAWPDHPIMPADPYDRAVARFWSHFSDDKLGPAVGAVFATWPGEEQKAATEKVHENLRLIETELREGAFRGRRFFGGDEIGFLDIVLGCGSYWLAVFEEVMEITIVDPESFPLFHAWLRDFERLPEVKETIPATDRLLEYARGVRHMMLSFGRSNSSSSPDISSSDTRDVAASAANAAKNDIVVDT